MLLQADIDAEVEYLPRRKKTASEREAGNRKNFDLGYYLWSLNSNAVSDDSDSKYRREKARQRRRELSTV